MTIYEQELTLFGGWAKARIPPPIEIGVERPLGTFSPSISIDPAPSINIQSEYFPVRYNGTVYQHKADARWAVFFDHVGSSFSYNIMESTNGVIGLFTFPFHKSVLSISMKPTDSEDERWLEYLRASQTEEIDVFSGDIWKKDLRAFQCVRYTRTSNIYGSDTPTSPSSHTFFDPTLNAHLRSLEMKYGLHIWIIQGHIFLYANGKITEYQRNPAHPDTISLGEETLTCLGVKIRDASLYKHLTVLNMVHSHIHEYNLREGSYFLRTEDVYRVEKQQGRRNCDGPHHIAIDSFIHPEVRNNHSKITAAYREARLATFRPLQIERFENPLQRGVHEVQQNPVVQEVIRLFQATMKDILLEKQPEYPLSQPASKSFSTTEVSRLTIAEVKARWESVLRRVKSKKDGVKIAALLRGYNIVGVDESTDLPTVILKASSRFHYHAMQTKGGELLLPIKWALQVELEQKCFLSLLSPEAPLP